MSDVGTENQSLALVADAKPSKQLEVDKHQTSFEFIGIADKFAFNHQVGAVEYSDFIPLPGISNQEEEFSLCLVKAPIGYVAFLFRK